MPPAALSQSGCHRGMGPANGSRRHRTVGEWQTNRFGLRISSSTMEKLNTVWDYKERTHIFYKWLHGFWYVCKQMFLIVQNFLFFEGYEGATSWKIFVYLFCWLVLVFHLVTYFTFDPKCLCFQTLLIYKHPLWFREKVQSYGLNYIYAEEKHNPIYPDGFGPESLFDIFS